MGVEREEKNDVSFHVCCFVYAGCASPESVCALSERVLFLYVCICVYLYLVFICCNCMCVFV